VSDDEAAAQPSSSPAVHGSASAHVESGAVDAVLASAHPPPAPKDKLEADKRKAESERLQISVKLAKLIGYGALIAVVIQVVLADVGFFFYGFTNDCKPPASRTRTRPRCGVDESGGA
jgi:hypothetical protein